MSRLLQSRPEAREALEAELVRRLGRIDERVATAARRAGRDPSHVRLVVVSKTATPKQVLAAHAAGAQHFGENRVQSSEARMQVFETMDRALRPCWHWIGRLQRNKAGPVVERFDRVDSLDSLRLAERIDRLARKADRKVPVLLQVNISEDPAKQGFLAREAPEAAAAIAVMPGLSIQGLMTIVFREGDERSLKASFAGLHRLRDELAKRLPDSSWDRLSMGMTDDFELAIEEGSTEIRVGRAIFEGLPMATPEEDLTP
jgi:pyridoxal phosphate enzyme (YggS family)